MGYSEVHCHICGVSFNIGRLRTPKEAQTQPSLPPELCADLARYTANAVFSLQIACDDMDGCTSREYPLPDRMEEEHVAGPNCNHEGGYQGRLISLEEMHGCCTVQCLVPKPSGWKPEDDDDEDVERDGEYFLTGLSDHMPSRDMEFPVVFPKRHGCGRAVADNCFWAEENRHEAAMPFHTACLEVYKRASLHRSGRIDVRGLTDWFHLEADWAQFRAFPRAEAVIKAREQWWRHVKGDEYLAANPCFVPGLQKILRTHASSSKCDEDRGRDVSDVDSTTMPFSGATDGFARLPYELRVHVLSELELADIKNLHTASPAFRSLPPSAYLHLLRREKPWLWETWCKLPYSIWATTTSTSLKRRAKEQEAEQNASDGPAGDLVEDHGDLSGSQEQEIVSPEKGPNKAADGENGLRKTTDVSILPSTRIDWGSVLIDTEDQRDKILGLRNRERIWRDCEEILDRIEKHRRQGSMRPI
ncbi:hypothetical protein LZ32DRAFT_79544 [Colletotrichum eremochloae]|nr:hypothetical protein LZ32DRAFT_79544 [Colletotrichum eremochloae]